MSEQQPELRWAPIPPPPKRRGRIWLIVGLSVLAAAIVVTLLVVFLPRGGSPEPTASPTDSASPSPSASASATPSPEPTPTRTPEVSPPPVGDPDLATFTGLVQPRLDDAVTGLGFLPGMAGQEAAQIVDQLQQDAERLADSVAPSSIASEWSTAVADYASKLVALRAAIDNASSTSAQLDAATRSLQVVRGLVGL
ncbi:hypothetical protein KZC51_09310 [Microbacterium sp. SSW1-49]|uniref:Uncharacterized protein n=1 Tax=Microbacterium croceum TaxID=2851645 RepID=A0ABT0FE43_9MICO|nr:hypothetical protein [Microbacterium croceum]MCK2036335.1 hypothetical protein [Microbacterium croceum]